MAPRCEDFVSVGPDALAGRYLRMFWQPVHLSSRLKIGRPVPVRILGEDFTLYRGHGGEAHMVAARCPHRGLSLAVGRVMGDEIECYYHGWRFAPSGQCVAQPAERCGYAEKVRIPAYPVRESRGLVFAFLGEGEPPDFPTLDIYEPGCYVQNRASERPWSFFSQIENGIDETHFNFVHRGTKFDDIGMNDEMPELSCEETEYGMLRIARRGDNVRKGHFLMPNWSLSSKYEHDEGWTNHVVWRVPVDDDRHISFMADVIYKTGSELERYHAMQREKQLRRKLFPSAIDVIKSALAGKTHPDDVPADHPDIILIQDGVACMGQSLRRNRGEDLLGASDRQVNMIRRIWNRELAALRDGRPLTSWKTPSNLMTTRGVDA